MPIKLTLREAIQAFHAIERLPKIPDAKVAYTLGRIGDLCEQEKRRYEKELQKLQRECFTPPDASGMSKIIPEKSIEYADRDAVMLDTEVEIMREPVTFDQVVGSKDDKPQIEAGVWRALAKIVLESK